jgi:hypothetical protein
MMGSTCRRQQKKQKWDKTRWLLFVTLLRLLAPLKSKALVSVSLVHIVTLIIT